MIMYMKESFISSQYFKFYLPYTLGFETVRKKKLDVDWSSLFYAQLS